MNIKKAGLHLLFWSCLYLFWVLVFQRHSFTVSRTLTVEFCYLIFIGSNYYFNVGYNIPRFLYQKKYLPFGLLFLGGICLGALLRVPLATYLNQHYFMAGQPSAGPRELFISSFLNIFIWEISLVCAKLILDRIRFQQYLEEMESEKAKTELDFLKAQFNPHFLFNSINSIYGHIDKNNQSARNMLLTFSEMLRYQLYECNTETISIDKEINYIKNYIALQQSRKEENLVVRFEADANIRGFKIVPLLFLAFIENSFKYVSGNEDKENRVEISFRKLNENLVFRCLNTKDPGSSSPIHHKGIGIANVKRRLELLYPGKYELSIGEQDRSYEVTLILQVA
jgi:two-component system, LytTR family, sensor kinase